MLDSPSAELEKSPSKKAGVPKTQPTTVAATYGGREVTLTAGGSRKLSHLPPIGASLKMVVLIDPRVSSRILVVNETFLTSHALHLHT
ncbi:hypothetical protein BaRGS_00006086 [Batillaria attramentaria]|uniref:Uncharacterized protein n=1 Tax=Batillaria attramentaria TaxID=370345 RepID=A0ABD0LUB0_9CAEN